MKQDISNTIRHCLHLHCPLADYILQRLRDVRQSLPRPITLSYYNPVKQKQTTLSLRKNNSSPREHKQPRLPKSGKITLRCWYIV